MTRLQQGGLSAVDTYLLKLKILSSQSVSVLGGRLMFNIKLNPIMQAHVPCHSVLLISSQYPLFDRLVKYKKHVTSRYHN